MDDVLGSVSRGVKYAEDKSCSCSLPYGEVSGVPGTLGAGFRCASNKALIRCGGSRDAFLSICGSLEYCRPMLFYTVPSCCGLGSARRVNSS